MIDRSGSGHALCMKLVSEEIAALDHRTLVGHNRSFDTKARIVDYFEHTIDDICLPSIYRFPWP